MVLHIFIFSPLYKFLYGSFISYYIVLFPATGKQHIAQYENCGLYSNTKLKNIVLVTFYNIFFLIYAAANTNFLLIGA